MGVRNQELKEIDEVAGLLYGCKEDMKAIWEDETVQQMLKQVRYILYSMAHLIILPAKTPNGRISRIVSLFSYYLIPNLTVISFLNDVDRITAPDYTPSDDDVIRARLRTLGVQEYKFVLEEGSWFAVSVRSY
jgi:guanine nucleotide-binding protein subunit alpha